MVLFIFLFCFVFFYFLFLFSFYFRRWATRILKLIYHAAFDCHLNYANTVWGQNKNLLNSLFLLQKKALRIISFKWRNAHSNPLSYRHEVVKLHDKIIIENCLFISKSINFDLPSIFSHWFTSDFHRHKPSCSSKGFLKVKITSTKKYGREVLINNMAIYRDGMIFKNICHLITCYMKFPLSNWNIY